MNYDLDVTVIITTYNRNNILNKTLEHITRLNRDGVNSEFVIVDNNSSDKTKQVVMGFSDRLPIRYLFEPRPGQNCARNRALAEATLGRIVAFTDDDVVPDESWLKAIVSVCQKWPQCSVFGGKIYIIWPDVYIPEWAGSTDIKGLAFAEHDHGQSECLYATALGKYPFSGNFWGRREIFDSGRKFNETITWQPKNRILATETMFLQQLSKEGHTFLYTPRAVVGHRITAEQLSLRYLIKRAYSGGRGTAHLLPLCRKNLLDEHPILWRLIRIGAITRLAFNMTTSLVPLALKKPENAVYAMRWIGYNVESLHIAYNHKGT